MMQSLLNPQRSAPDNWHQTRRNENAVWALLGYTSLPRATVTPRPDAVLVTVKSVADLDAWRDTLNGRLQVTDVPGGFRSAVLYTRTPESRRGSVEVRVAVVYPADAVLDAQAATRIEVAA